MDNVVALQVRHLAIVVGITFAAAVLGFLLLGNTDLGQDLSFVYPVALFGSIGGTANAAQRVVKLAQEPESVQAAVPPRLAVAQTWLSPLIGLTFAGVLYSLFLAEMIQGEFFPAFACAGDAFSDYRAFSTCNPTTNGDAAMALVWGFLAGFAERLVPNVLDRFTGDNGASSPRPSTVADEQRALPPDPGGPR